MISPSPDHPANPALATAPAAAAIAGSRSPISPRKRSSHCPRPAVSASRTSRVTRKASTLFLPPECGPVSAQPHHPRAEAGSRHSQAGPRSRAKRAGLSVPW